MKLVSLLLAYCLWSVSAFRPSSFVRRVTGKSFTSNHVPTTEVASSSPLFVASPGTPGGDSSEWTKKRLHNTAAFRSLALLGALALAGFSSPGLPSRASASLHILAFATWFGSVAYTTFIAGITMFKNLPRQTFGKLQAKLFPKYFALGSVTLLLQLFTIPNSLPPAVKSASTKALSTALVMTLANQFYLEPLSTNNMMRRYELEGQEGGQQTDEYKQLKASFGKFHGMSSLTNLIALCGGVAHAVYLSGSFAP